MKRLSEYLAALGGLVQSPSPAHDFEASGVANNSKLVREGFLFCAIPGAKNDGHRFLPDAAAAGAAAAFVAKEPGELPDCGIPLIKVSDPYFAWAVLCERFFDSPARRLSLHGMTGTNGKTTSAFILRRLLERTLGAKCGLISTVKYDTGSGSEEEASRTTPDAFEIQRLFSEMLSNGCSHAVMEASSHGLHQRRTGRAEFASASFSNLTGDHLDYHRDMESYYQAKKLLFSEMLAPCGAAIINIDDSWGARLFDELQPPAKPQRILSLSKSRDSFCKIQIEGLSDSGTLLALSIGGRLFRFKTNLIGEHNAFNLAAAATMALSSGAEPNALEAALAEPFSVPGRLEGFILPSGARAFVDYAHTDDALFRVLSALKPLCKGSLITVFGCGGDRDRTKRPRMAAISAKLSSLSIVTSDNPRTEDPLEIIAQIEAGFPEGSPSLEIPDRLQAISKAVGLAKPSDIVLIAGKGHENYQETDGVKRHFDDREVLKSLGAAASAP